MSLRYVVQILLKHNAFLRPVKDCVQRYNSCVICSKYIETVCRAGERNSSIRENFFLSIKVFFLHGIMKEHCYVDVYTPNKHKSKGQSTGGVQIQRSSSSKPDMRMEVCIK